jgi:type IV pilus assembly protein PilO
VVLAVSVVNPNIYVAEQKTVSDLTMASSTSTNSFDTFLDEKYIPLEKKVKIIIVIAAVVVPIVLFYLLSYTPGQEKIAGIEQRISTARADLLMAQKAAADLPRVEREVAETKKAFELAAVVLPKTSEIPDLLRDISDLGKRAGLDFLTFKPGTETAKDFYAEIPVDIAIRGSYHNMGIFLDQVSRLARIVSVNNIKMGAPKKEGGEMLLNSTCRLVTYRFTGVTLPSEEGK